MKMASYVVCALTLLLRTSPAQSAGDHRSPDSIQYNSHYATLQLAINAVCNGVVAGTVALPTGVTTINAELSIPGNCTIAGQGNSRTILQPSANMISPAMQIQSVSTVFLRDLQVNGNRQSDAANVDCVDIVSAHNVVLDSVAVVNCRNNGILIAGSSTDISIRNSDIYNCGPMNPGAQGPAAILIGAISSGSAVSRVFLKGNRIHDSATGFSATNSRTPGLDMVDFEVTGNKIYSNANDGILITTTNMVGGNITGLRVEGNEIYCNGWPKSGVDFSPHCAPGFQQKGQIESQGGVGVDLIQSGSARLVRPIVDENRIHDNVFEGVATTTTGDANAMPTVNIAGKNVTWTSGPVRFDYVSPGQYVWIERKMYAIASVVNSKSLALQTSPGNRTGASMAIPAYMGAIIRNNVVSDSGNTSRAVGPCFYNQLADGNVYSGNTAIHCAFEGYENFMSSFLSYTGDRAYSNNSSETPGHDAGFTASGSYGTSWLDVVASDVTTSPTQTYGVFLNSTVSKAMVRSQFLVGSNAVRDDSHSASINAKVATSAKHTDYK